MGKVELYGLKITEEIDPVTDIAALAVEAARGHGCRIERGDVVVLTSKIVSKAEGRMVKIDEIRPSRKARTIGRYFKKPPEVIELYLREGEIVCVIPLRKIARGLDNLFERFNKDREAEREVIGKDPYIFIVSVGGMLLTGGGLDFSNCPPGYCTLLPRDPDASARGIREGIRDLVGGDVAVVLTDTEIKYDKFGTQDIAVGSSGIRPVSGDFGGKDLYGKPKVGGIDNLTDLVSAAANLLFGQTSQSVPVVIIRGLEYESSEAGVKDTLYSGAQIKRAMRQCLWENLKYRAVSMFL